MKTFKQFINEEISKSVLNNLETYLDKLYKSLGVDVEFSKHFHDRLNDPRNGEPITRDELYNLFKKAKQKHGGYIKKMTSGAEAVISDMETDNNMPFGIEVVKGKKGIDLELTGITIMRKKNFKTGGGKYKNSPKLKVGAKTIKKGGHQLGTKYSEKDLAAMRKRLGR